MQDEVTTREEAIEIITNALQADENKYTEKIDKALALAQKALKQEPKTEWISVENRLPEIVYYGQQNEVRCSDEVVAQIYDRQLDVSYCEVLRYCEDGDDKFWANTIFRIKNTVIAWMPLPAPYKESEDNFKKQFSQRNDCLFKDLVKEDGK